MSGHVGSSDGTKHQPCLALDRLYQERRRVLSVELQCAFEVRDLSITDRPGHTAVLIFRTNGAQEGSETPAALRIGAHAIPHAVYTHCPHGRGACREKVVMRG